MVSVRRNRSRNSARSFGASNVTAVFVKLDTIVVPVHIRFSDPGHARADRPLCVVS